LPFNADASVCLIPDISWMLCRVARTQHVYRRQFSVASLAMQPKRIHKRDTELWSIHRLSTFIHPVHFSTDSLTGWSPFILLSL